MAIELGSWADFGYRKVGPLPASGGGLSAEQAARRLADQSDYQVTAGHWVRRHARRKGAAFTPSIEVVTVLDKDTQLDDERLAFVDRHARSEWTAVEASGTRARAEPDVLVEAVGSVEAGEERWRGLYRLAQALFYIGPERLRPMLRQQVAPCFFRLYPQGRIVVIRYDTGVDAAAALMRAMYALSQAPPQEILAGEFEGVQTLREWHMASLPTLAQALLDLFSHLFYPHVGGACAGLPGLAFLFLLDPPERHEIAPFPRNWLGFPARSASFGREQASFEEVVEDFGGPAYHRAGHQRHCHERGFSAGEREALLRWFIGRINVLLYELTDVANFTAGRDPQAAVDPVFGFEHQLTVDRLMRKTLTAMSLDEAPVGNLMAFEVADLYDTLSERFGNHKDKTDFFKRLFHTQDGPALLAPRFAGMPAPFGDYFADLAREVYAKIEETVLASVWRRAKVTPGGVLVRDKELSAEAPMPAPQFVAEVMRSYRNAHHGYFSADPVSRNRPLRFLHLVNGNLPVEMSALPSLWWLAYLADPGLVGWRPLGIGVWD